MHFDKTITGHPKRRQLVTFAESLVDRHASASALVARHVANCPGCAREVKQIRGSFDLVALAKAPEPSPALMSRIIAQARRTRRQQEQTPAVPAVLRRLMQGGGCIVGILVVAWLSFSTALNVHVPHESERVRTFSRGTAPAPAPAPVAASAVHCQAATVKALSTAVALQQEADASPHQLGQRRALDALHGDVTAALAALERNPGCLRANQVMRLSLERQIEELRNLYLARML